MSYDFSNEAHKSFQRVVRLMARAFYDEAPPLEKKLRPGQSDNKGLGVLILDRLTNIQWVKEEELANMLHVRRKQVASLLHFFHQEKLINLEYRKEEIKSAKASGDDDDLTAIDGQNKVNKGQEKNDKDKMNDKEKKEKEKKKYKDDEFQEKKRFRTVTYTCIDYAQEQLRPINNQLQVLKDLSPPEFFSLQALEAKHAVINEPADVGISDTKEEHLKEKPKFIPHWMKRKHMYLTEEQSEEVKEGNDSSSFTGPNSEDSKPTDNAKSVDEDYIKSYYAQLTKNTSTQDSTEHCVAQKSKREESDEEESDWDDPFETGISVGQRREDSNDANGPHKAQEKKGSEVEDEDDDIEWE